MMHRTVIVRTANMAADSCVFHRTLTRSRPASNKASCPVVCRESLHVVDIRRYSRDQSSPVFFPQAVFSGDDLYDVTLTDRHCRLQVTLDPGLNRLVERRVLKPGSVVCNAAFSPALSAQLPECPGASSDRDSYRLVSVQVRDADPDEEEEEDEEFRRSDWDSLPWFGSEPTGPLVPLRANRSVFLPLWNNVDHSGEVWREAPPTDEDEEDEGRRPGVTVSELRDFFLSGRRGAVQHQLIVRIINKSHLMYYGRTDRNCDCPYKAVLQVSDPTGSVCVVLWNSVCVDWYRCLRPGDIISLRHYRVKQHYQMEVEDIELSVNSRNPAALISVYPQSSVSPEHLPPAPTYSFYNSKDLSERAHSGVCDVIGLLTFTGRSERVRSKDGHGAELLEYRWLRLEDGSSSQPIMVKLFSTSQPETHLKLHPLSVVVCTHLKVIRTSDQTDPFYLTNTTFTQVYCTGLGHHSQMSYRKLRQVRLFLRWLKSQEDQQVLSRALIGGFFIYPPPPVSLETLMKERRGELGFLQGAELQRELDRLCYRERRCFCIQATVTMVTYSCRGQEDRCLFWMDRASSHSSSSSPCLLSSPPLSFRPSSSPSFRLSSPSFRPSSSSPSLRPSSSSPSLRPSSSPSLRPSSPPSFRPSSSPSFRPSSPPSFRPSSSSSSLTSPSSAVSHSSPRPADLGARKRRQQLLADTLKKRRPQLTVQPDNNQTVILFEASMEFLGNPTDEEEQDDEDEDASSFTAAPLPPVFPPVAMETLPMRYNHTRREEQLVAVAMGGGATCERFDSSLEDYYTLRLRVPSDGLLLDTIFLPHFSSSSPSVLRHANTWTSILSHGAFSSHTPPPSPADLIAMASQLANQRLVCVLEACHLGGARTEVVLSRAFLLTD